MAFSRETKLRVPKARLPTSSTKSTVKMPVGSKSESSFTQSTVKMQMGPPKSESSSTQSSLISESSYTQLSVNSQSSFTQSSVKSETSSTRSTSVKMPVGQKFESASTRSSVKLQVGPKSESASTKSSVNMAVGPKSVTSCGRFGERTIKDNSTNPNSKTSRYAAERVLSKIPQWPQPKQEFNLCDPILPVHSVNPVDDQSDLDLFKDQHYDRALTELNLQSPNIASSVVTHEKQEIVSPIDGCRYNPIQEGVIVLHPSDANRDMSSGNVTVTWEKGQTNKDSQDRYFTLSTESIGSNSILSIATPFVSKSVYLDGTKTEHGEFNSNGLSFDDFLSEANTVGDHLLSCSHVSVSHCNSTSSVSHCNSTSYSHDKLAPRCLDYEDETSFASTMKKSLMQLEDEMDRLMMKALEDELENNNDRQYPLYWPLNLESYWTIEGC